MFKTCEKFMTVVILLFSLSACGMGGGPVSGKVIDRKTGQPIEGAIVVAYWEGSVFNLVHTTRRCFHVESTTSDKEGKYKIPFWMGMPKGIVDQKKYLRAYKQGYDEIGYNKKENVMAMKPFTGSRGERFKFLLKMLERTRCPSAGKSIRNLYQLYNAFYEEAESLAVTEQEKKSAKGYKQRALNIRKSKGKFGKVIYKP